jgi:hypothetical protein
VVYCSGMYQGLLITKVVEALNFRLILVPRKKKGNSANLLPPKIKVQKLLHPYIAIEYDADSILVLPNKI